MPRAKARRKTRRVVRKKKIDRQMEHFGKEVEAIGKRMEGKGDEWDSWFHRTFGVIGPLISSVFCLLILVLVVWMINFINNYIGSNLLPTISAFIMINLGLFFLIFLFFSYTSYFSRVNPRVYRPFSPIVSAIGLTIALWIIVRVINISNVYIASPILSDISYFIDTNLYLIFWFFLVLGYLILLIRLSCCKTSGEVYMKKSRAKTVKAVRTSSVKGSAKVRRLYRSGKDKILGGVCGGIAEYLGVDPVIIRLLWVIAIFGWGFGILAYIIAWIIIPRNPRHQWKD